MNKELEQGDDDVHTFKAILVFLRLSIFHVVRDILHTDSPILIARAIA